jgi:hypothetical protein
MHDGGAPAPTAGYMAEVLTDAVRYVAIVRAAMLVWRLARPASSLMRRLRNRSEESAAFASGGVIRQLGLLAEVQLGAGRRGRDSAW